MPTPTVDQAPGWLDPTFYRWFYPDLRELDDAALHEHFGRFGRIEGRAPNSDALIAALEQELGALPPGFDEAGYLARYPDVRCNLSFPRAGAYHFLSHGRAEGRGDGRPTLYAAEQLHRQTHRVYDLPDIVVSAATPPRINVLVPQFDIATMSAGFFGVFQVARYIARCGLAVRLVLFDEFDWDEDEFRLRLRDFPGLEHLLDELEVTYIGDRAAPLEISPHDNCVATVWYSAYLADRIMAMIGRGPFLYLIQDHESLFHPGSTHHALAEATYALNCHALFSSQPLRDYFLQHRIGRFADAPPPHCWFNNACTSNLPPRATFLERATRPYRLAFYSRPSVPRNMFELGALALIEACKRGIFDVAEWEFLGVGIGDLRVELARGAELRQVPRMTLCAYRQAMADFDLGLSLMASPHPSLVPFDLAGSGALVVTNTFGPKSRAWFAGISDNIIAAPPTLEAIVAALHDAARRVTDRKARWRGASNMAYPTRWEDSFGDDHIALLRNTFASTWRAAGHDAKPVPGHLSGGELHLAV